MEEFDFFETPIMPATILQEGAEVTIHVRCSETMEQKGVRGIVSQKPESMPEGNNVQLHLYGRLGIKMNSDWFIHVLEEMEDSELATDHVLAQSMDSEQSLGSPESFKKSRYRNDDKI